VALLGRFKYLFLLIPAICFAQDSWFGKDKKQHFAGSAVISYSLSEVMSPTNAFLTSVGVGLAKEIYDYKHPDKHTASYKDLVADIAGAYVGVYAKGYSFNYDSKTFTIRYTMQIK
jgi:putative lipoprotein